MIIIPDIAGVIIIISSDSYVEWGYITYEGAACAAISVWLWDTDGIVIYEKEDGITST